MAISTFEADEVVARANVNQRINQANAYFPVSVANGGTGKTSLTSGNILLGNGTSGITSTATLPVTKGGTGQTSFTSGNVLLGNGTNGFVSVNFLPVTKGGTGKIALMSGEILLGNGTDGITSTAILPQSKGGTGVSSFYSSGTWTPAIKQGASSYLSRHGMYYQIGDMVYVNFSFQVSGSSSYDLIVTGLPFTADNSENTGYAHYPLSVLYATGLSYKGYELAGRVIGTTVGIVFKNSMSTYAHFTEYLAQFTLAGWYKKA